MNHSWWSIGPVDECVNPGCGVVRCMLVGSPDCGKYSAPLDPDDPELGRGDFMAAEPGCQEGAESQGGYVKHLFLVEIDHGPTTYDPEDMARVLAEAIKAAVRDGYVLLAHTKDGLDSAKGFTVIPWSPEGPSRVYDATQVRF